MWRAINFSRENTTPLPISDELIETITRKLILVTMVTPLIISFTIALIRPEIYAETFFLFLLLIGIGCGVALWLLPRAPGIAQVIWLLDLLLVITFSLIIFQDPSLFFLYAFLPLAASGLLGWPVGLLVGFVVIGIFTWLPAWLGMPDLTLTHRVALIFGTLLSWLFGWAITHSLLSITTWALSQYRLARQNTEADREQRLEMKQIQEDLVKANQELARLSNQLKAMYQVAEEARHAKEEFVANVSHELRTPLNMIIAFSEMITRTPAMYGMRLPPALLADISIIQRNSTHLSKLVDDVLDLSQVEAGRMALSREWVPVKEVVESACKAVEALFRSKGLYLQIEIADNLPDLYCDRTRIRQILVNLLSNAGRFTEQGGVLVGVNDQAGEIIFRVADTGPGIAPENQKRLFEPFQQLDSSIRRTHGGSGLGLSISKRFVEMHNGTIGIESEPGVGTTFIFSLPIDQPIEKSMAVGESASRWFNPYQEYTPRTRKFKAPVPSIQPRFLVLEGGETLTRLIQRQMDSVELVTAASFEDAALALNQSPANALLVNALTVKIAESDLDRLSQELPFGIPTISCWVPNEVQISQHLGAVKYLLKPVTLDKLLEAVRQLGSHVKTVLVADDEPDIQQLFSRLLQSEEAGYRVLRAENGLQALQMMREHHPQAVLLDLMMPEMDGFRVLREKNSDPQIADIPVIVVTSRDPSNEPIISDRLTVSRSGGISSNDLLACIAALSSILNPGGQPDAKLTETPPA